MEYHIRWDLCVLCQEETSESVKQPARSNNPKSIESTYNDAARLLKEFADINESPGTFFPQLSIDCLNREVFADLLINNKATWHAYCKSKITQTKLSKCTSTIKRKSTESKVGPTEPKKTRSQIQKFDQNACFIPGCAVETSGEEPLRAVMYWIIDQTYGGRFDCTGREISFHLCGFFLHTCKINYAIRIRRHPKMSETMNK